jgi:hypothetical protein
VAGLVPATSIVWRGGATLSTSHWDKPGDDKPLCAADSKRSRTTLKTFSFEAHDPGQYFERKFSRRIRLI